MPYVVGEYHSSAFSGPVLFAALHYDDRPVKECRRSVTWQLKGAGRMGARCKKRPPEMPKGCTQVWHVCDPMPEPLMMKCRDCGGVLKLARGCYTHAAWVEEVGRIWPGSTLPPQDKA